jgi:AcrR family transcriptional regulator
MATDPDSDPNHANLWSNVQPKASRRMLVAAIEAFSEHGFAAATTREIAERCGMSPAAVYVHYKSKTDLLHTISRVGTQSSLDAVTTAVENAESATEWLRRFVAAFVTWHAHNRTLASVIQFELSALPPEQFSEIRELREQIEDMLRGELRRGARAGDFEISDHRTTNMAILSLGIDVARWYRAGRGRPSPETLGARYAELVLRMVAPHHSAA